MIQGKEKNSIQEVDFKMPYMLIKLITEWIICAQRDLKENDKKKGKKRNIERE